MGEAKRRRLSCAEAWPAILEHVRNHPGEGPDWRVLFKAALANGWTWENSGIDPALIDGAKAVLDTALGCHVAILPQPKRKT
jgi:hypothetical protein